MPDLDGLMALADAIGMRLEQGQLPPQDENGNYIIEAPCPTCGAVAGQQCVRGRKPSAIWAQQTPYPEGHDGRRTLNRR